VGAVFFGFGGTRAAKEDEVRKMVTAGWLRARPGRAYGPGIDNYFNNNSNYPHPA
jgi:hypothetical protein